MTTINGNLTYLDEVGYGFHRKRDIDALLAAQEGLCFFCASRLENHSGGIKFDIDHLQPLCNEGTNWPDNLALTCPLCNSEKHWRTERQYWNLLKKKHGDEWVTKRRNRTNKFKKIGKQLASANSDERSAALEMLMDNLRDNLRPKPCSDAMGPDLHLEERRIVVHKNCDIDYRMYPVVYLRLGKIYIPTNIPFGGRLPIVRWYNANGKSIIRRLRKLQS